MTEPHHKRTHAVQVGPVRVGGGAPVVIQSMTNTDTADIASTAQQCIELASAGSEMVRITVNVPEAAAAVPEIKKRMLDAGCQAPLIGDFHYNGHVLLTNYPDAAKALDKYRINPGNVGAGKRRDEQFSTICAVARDNGKPVRIGVNGGSLNQELVMRKMQDNTDQNLGFTSDEIVNECMVLSALESTDLALECGLRENQIVISCKVSRPRHPHHRVSRACAPHAPTATSRSHGSRYGHEGRHLGPPPPWASCWMKGSGTPFAFRSRPAPVAIAASEVYACCELLQALGLRAFLPSVTGLSRLRA